MIGFW
jgi:hypothetical protein